MLKQNGGQYEMNGDVNQHDVVLKNLVVVADDVSDNNTVEIPLEDISEDNSKEPGSQKDSQQPSRQQWNRPVEFLLSCIAMSVGLGNIWRFPFVAYENGGGAFLIPYILVLFFVGKPVYFLEMCMGQFASKGSGKLWQVAPFFKGVGYGATFASACVLTFYCALMAITVFYLFQSFNTELPWTVCRSEWEELNITCLNNTAMYNGIVLPVPELYFKREVYAELDSIANGIGYPDWRLSLSLLVSWVCIFASLMKGVHSVGKLAYFSALFPYVVLIIFLIRGVTLEGAKEGILYFVTPQWHKLLEGKIYLEAVKQAFFSLSISFGSVITFASFNEFSHNVYKDCMIVSFMDTFTSVLAGISTFSVLGNLASLSGVGIDKVVKGGPGLAFVSYPGAIASFPFPQFFSFLFFSMLFTLGIGSAISIANTVITVIHDKFNKIDKRVITSVVCVVGFSTGLLYVTPGGLYILNLVDHFGAGSNIFVLGILEMIGLIFVYGLPAIVRDIQFMLGRRISLYWQYCWVLTPAVLLGTLIYELAKGEPFTYEGKPYPTIALVFGWLLVGIAILMLPVFALHGVKQQEEESGFINKLKQSFRPLDEWGPLNSEDRRRWEVDKEVQMRRPSLVGKFFIKH